MANSNEQQQQDRLLKLTQVLLNDKKAAEGRVSLFSRGKGMISLTAPVPGYDKNLVGVLTDNLIKSSGESYSILKAVVDVYSQNELTEVPGYQDAVNELVILKEVAELARLKSELNDDLSEYSSLKAEAAQIGARKRVVENRASDNFNSFYGSGRSASSTEHKNPPPPPVKVS